MNYERRVNSMVTEAAKAAQVKAGKLAMAGIPVTLYMYYQPATAKEDGKLILVHDDEKQPAGYVLATGEGLRGGVPYENYPSWVRARVGHLPILAWEN